MNPFELVTVSNPQASLNPEATPTPEDLQRQQEQKREASVNNARCEALIQDENFLWFLEQVNEIRAREHKAALDISQSLDARNNAAQRYDIVSDVMNLINVQREFWANAAK